MWQIFSSDDLREVKETISKQIRELKNLIIMNQNELLAELQTVKDRELKIRNEVISARDKQSARIAELEVLIRNGAVREDVVAKLGEVKDAQASVDELNADEPGTSVPPQQPTKTPAS